jgi:hypothetical protein
MAKATGKGAAKKARTSAKKTTRKAAKRSATVKDLDKKNEKQGPVGLARLRIR